MELFKGVTQLKILFYTACYLTRCFLCLLLLLFFLFSGGRRSYQTGIHHKSTSSPELGQLPTPQRYSEAGEQRARHQVEQSRLTHLHHSQGHEGDEQADAVRWQETRREESFKVQSCPANTQDNAAFSLWCPVRTGFNNYSCNSVVNSPVSPRSTYFNANLEFFSAWRSACPLTLFFFCQHLGNNITTEK